MTFGDVLRKEAYKLIEADESKKSDKAFWIILRDIAAKDIKELYPHKVDSSEAVPLYYEILKENIDYIPTHYRARIPSNGHERYRVLVRNLFTSNAFHNDGLANQPGINARKEINQEKKGERVVYQGEKRNVD